MGSTTWGKEEADRGIEADECFYFAPEKIKVANEAIARKSNIRLITHLLTWPSKSI